MVLNIQFRESKRYIKKNFDRFFREEKTFATLRLTGKGKDLKQRFINQINDGLSIISLSQLGYSRRSHNSSPVLSMEKILGKRSSFMFNLSSDTSFQANEVVGKLRPLSLDERWNNFQKKSFFL